MCVNICCHTFKNKKTPSFEQRECIGCLGGSKSCWGCSYSKFKRNIRQFVFWHKSILFHNNHTLVFRIINDISPLAIWYTALPYDIFALQIWYNIRFPHTRSVYHLRSRYHSSSYITRYARNGYHCKKISFVYLTKEIFLHGGEEEIRTLETR